MDRETSFQPSVSSHLASCVILFVPDDDFDPVEIADKLRSVADALNDDVNFRAALTDLKKAAAKEVTERERETHTHTRLSLSGIQWITCLVSHLWVKKALPALLLYKLKCSFTSYL